MLIELIELNEVIVLIVFPPLLVFQKVACTILNSGYNKMATFWSPTTKAADVETV